MKKYKYPLIPILGILLILLSVALIIVFQVRTNIGIQHSRKIVSIMEQILPERTAGIPGLYPNSGMPVLQIANEDYVALIDIPSFGISLPVSDRWDSRNLSRSPARFFGSAYDSPLIIGGIDHSQQFNFCNKIEHGALVTVTDMTGAQFSYVVARVDRAKHAESQWLTDTSFDLTLFYHNIYTMEYIAVRCIFAYR